MLCCGQDTDLAREWAAAACICLDLPSPDAHRPRLPGTNIAVRVDSSPLVSPQQWETVVHALDLALRPEMTMTPGGGGGGGGGGTSTAGPLPPHPEGPGALFLVLLPAWDGGNAPVTALSCAFANHRADGRPPPSFLECCWARGCIASSVYHVMWLRQCGGGGGGGGGSLCAAGTTLAAALRSRSGGPYQSLLLEMVAACQETHEEVRLVLVARAAPGDFCCTLSLVKQTQFTHTHARTRKRQTL
jgi:hypothetical protein